MPIICQQLFCVIKLPKYCTAVQQLNAQFTFR